MKTMTVAQFIESVNDGKMFSVTFVKKDKSLRQMTARRGVSKGVINDPKNTNASWNRQAQDAMHEVLTVYDVNKIDDTKPLEDNRGAFRRINLKTIQKVKVHGVEYRMDGDSNTFVEV